MEVLITFLMAIFLAALVLLAGFFFLRLMMSIMIINEEIAKFHEIERESEKMLRRLEDGD